MKLPISDYITDTRSVLDQIPRLLAAMQYISLGDASVGGSFDLMCVFSKVRQVIHTKNMVSKAYISKNEKLPLSTQFSQFSYIGKPLFLLLTRLMLIQ